jgi:hypothetical protein
LGYWEAAVAAIVAVALAIAFVGGWPQHREPQPQRAAVKPK